MTGQRTTIILDERSRAAAADLASHYRCSVAEAIRRAILGHRDAVKGVPPARRRERVAALRELARLFKGTDADAEVKELKRADRHS